MLIFRLVLGLMLVAAILCFAMSVGTGSPTWRRRGVVLMKWALIASLGFFAVLVLERLAVLL